MWAMRCVYGALVCIAWVIFVLVFVGLDTTSDTIGFLFRGAIVGGMVLAPTGGVLAISDRSLTRWKRVAAITFGVIVPGAAILLFLAFLVALDQLN